MSAKVFIQDGIELRHLRKFVADTARYDARTPVVVGVLKTTASFEYSQPFTIETRSVGYGEPTREGGES